MEAVKFNDLPDGSFYRVSIVRCLFFNFEFNYLEEIIASTS